MMVSKIKTNQKLWRSVLASAFNRGASGKATSTFDGKLVGNCKPVKLSTEKRKLYENECPKVVILGAGMAGMSAASLLANAGIDDFTIYEASKRIGGRIYSAWCGEGLNELGAEWLEGEWNPVLRLASLEALTICQENMYGGIYLGEDGLPLSKHVVYEAKDKYRFVLEEAGKEFCDKRESDFYNVSLLDYINKKEEELQWRQTESKALFRTMVNGGSCKLGGAVDKISLNDISLRFRYEKRQRIREGLVAVFGPMLKDVPQNRIKLGHKVQTIHWGECPTKVIFDDCSEETADFIIVTFSLGVLKNDVELFVPELPEPKLEAIRNTGYDTVNKIFLDYAEPFWLRGDGRAFLSRQMNHHAKDWQSAIFEVREICGGRNTLQISLCGEPAVEMETVEEGALAKKITPLLRKFTGVATTPYPIGVTRTAWSHDPLYMGSISYVGKHCNKRHLTSLSSALPTLKAIPKLLFAGDATSGGHIGSVEGARLSGFREAQRIIDIVSEHGWPPKPRHNLNQYLTDN